MKPFPFSISRRIVQFTQIPPALFQKFLFHLKTPTTGAGTVTVGTVTRMPTPMQREKQDPCPSQVLLDKAVPMPIYQPLDLFENLFLELPLHLLALVVGRGFTVQSHEGPKIELRLLQQLDLSDVHLINPVSSQIINEAYALP